MLWGPSTISEKKICSVANCMLIGEGETSPGALKSCDETAGMWSYHCDFETACACECLFRFSSLSLSFSLHRPIHCKRLNSAEWVWERGTFLPWGVGSASGHARLRSIWPSSQSCDWWAKSNSWAYFRNVVMTNGLQYCQLLRNTHFTHKLQCAKAQGCFPVLAFDLIRECYVVATTSEATSCTRLC